VQNAYVGIATELQSGRRGRTALAWWLAGILTATCAVVAVPALVYLWPPAANQLTVPSIQVQNLDGPDVIVNVGPASARLGAGQHESWPTRTIYSEVQFSFVIQRADDRRILFQKQFRPGQASYALGFIVRWPGVVWQT
jgi:hypothetical protein